MADKKTSQLNAATTIFDADDFAVVQDGETKQANASVVKTYVKDGLSKSDVGLGNVDNTSDLNKPISTATQTALDGKEPADATLLKSAAIGVSVQAYDADLTAWAGKTAPTGNAVGTSDSQTLTNKTISGSNNTLSNIGNTSLTNSSITINGNAVSLGGSTTVTATASNPLTLGTGLTGTSYNGSSAVTVAIDTSVVTTLTGTQTLTNKTLSGANNTLSNIGNASLTNSAITFGATAVSLGGTVSGLNGVSIGASSASTGAFTNLSYTGTLTGGTGVIAIGTNQIYKDASGNVGIGVTDFSTSGANAKFAVAGGTFNLDDSTSLAWGGGTGRVSITGNKTAGTLVLSASNTSGSTTTFNVASNGQYIWNAGGTERLRINASGVLTIGSAISLDPTTANSLVVNSSGKLGVNVTPSAGTDAKLQVTGLATNATTLATAYSVASFVLVPKSTSGFSLAFASGTGDSPQLQVSANGAAAGDLLIQPYGGNVISGAPATPPSLSTNGTMVFNLTSNTNLRVSVRGSDGVTRTGSIPLS
jgi:hypothetical protein